MSADEQFVDHGAGRGASGTVDAGSDPPRYVVAADDDVVAIAARFAVPPLALIGTDDRPVHMPLVDLRRDLIPGETLSIALSLRSISWLQDADVDGLAGEAGAASDDGDGFELPDPHPAYLRAFPSDLYVDEADEFAPFGTDEGSDARWSIFTRSRELPPTMTLTELLEWELDDGVDEALDGTDESIARELDPVVIGVAFTLLWSTGRIDAAGKAHLLAAIDRQIRRYGDDSRLAGMAADVAALP